MPTRKKKSTTEEAPVEKKEAPRAVTQVVEVIIEEIPEIDSLVIDKEQPPEQDDDMVTAEAAPPKVDPEPLEDSEPVIHNRMVSEEGVPDLLSDNDDEAEPAVAEAMADKEEERKEMVDELFQPEPKVEEPQKAAASAMMSDISVHKKRSMMPIVWWALIVIVVAALTGGGILFATGGGKNLPGLAAAPTPTPTPAPPTPTPTPAAPVVKNAVKIQVLNGSGVTGVAKKMKSLLEEKGYVVEKTGNADNEDFTQTEIHVKADKVPYLAALEEDLKGSYTIGANAADLSEDSPYDVQIIIGKE
jgi:hypothetical protein